MGKFGNRVDNTLSIPSRSVQTLGQVGIDVINSLVGLPRDCTSVVLNTKNKIADLFSKDLRRYHYIGNTPVALLVGIAGAFEALAKPIVNGGVNFLFKTPANFLTNAGKSTLGSLLSTKPLSDFSFNHLKIGKIDIKLNTADSLRGDTIVSKNRGFLTPSQRKAQLEEKKRKIEEKKRKIEAKIAALGA